MASRLLPADNADRAAVVYAWCRRADDAVDEAPPAEHSAALAQLDSELDALESGNPPQDVLELVAFDAVRREARMPLEYPREMVAGMRMDAEEMRYETLDDLLLYCFRVAGTVGLMMSHVMGVRSPEALAQATHMGLAMQLTNICRDVAEDWELGRLYLPDDLLAEAGCGALRDRLGQGPFPPSAVEPVKRVVARLLAEADGYYASGDLGLPALSWRSALAVRAARRIYSAIGRRVEAQGCDITRGRAFVAKPAKLLTVAGCLLRAALEAPGRSLRPFRAADLGGHLVRFPDDVLPLTRPA